MQNLNEKKILGTVTKKLQLVETFWDCPEFSRNKQNQKGITLIALIITIIVMLILVGVTINVVLTGGLFTKAEEAKKGTQIASENEQLLNAILGTLDDNGKFNLNEIELPNGFKKVSEDGSKVIYEGPSTNQYEVDKVTGKIEENDNNENNDNTLTEDDILGLYGKKEILAIEILENGECVLYQEGTEFEGEYNDGVATAGGMTVNYTIDLIKDEQSGEIINKIIYFEYGGDTLFLTTQELAGLDTDSYNNKHYEPNDLRYSSYYFHEGWYEFSIGSTSQYNYFVYQNWIWKYDRMVKGVEGVYENFEKIAKISSDGTFTVYYDDVELIYTEVK